MFLLFALMTILVMAAPLSYAGWKLKIPSYMNNYKLIFSHLLLALGLFLIIDGMHSLEMFAARKNWQKVTGTVTESRIAGKRAYHPEIKFTYHVQGKTYHNVSDMDAPGFGTKAARRQVAREWVNSLQPGDSISVWFNPDNPAQSELIHHPPWNTYMKYGAGIFFSALALAFIVVGILQRLSLKKELNV
ncbi:MAG: DUF3592 domain-containing protein [Calditrichaeota bacterium]|nr:MAG: DUF3592 domain-containing protein [Calditrichota bacterium]